jgi:hypothetical protein
MVLRGWQHLGRPLWKGDTFEDMDQGDQGDQMQRRDPTDLSGVEQLRAELRQLRPEMEALRERIVLLEQTQIAARAPNRARKTAACPV